MVHRARWHAVGWGVGGRGGGGGGGGEWGRVPTFVGGMQLLCWVSGLGSLSLPQKEKKRKSGRKRTPWGVLFWLFFLLVFFSQ